jgi:hypothetical protein
MATQGVIRQPQPHQDDSVRALIETVATETFTDLFAPNPVPLKFEDDDWRLTSVAASDTKILGIMLTNQEWVSDLWVLREPAGKVSEAILLARGELEIAARGHNTCRLRVVKSNTVAVQFYLSRGWQIVLEFAHEKYHHAMLETAKTLPGNLHSVR